MKYVSHIHVPPALFGFCFSHTTCQVSFPAAGRTPRRPPSSSFSQGSCCDITTLVLWCHSTAGQSHHHHPFIPNMWLILFSFSFCWGVVTSRARTFTVQSTGRLIRETTGEKNKRVTSGQTVIQEEQTFVYSRVQNTLSNKTWTIPLTAVKHRSCQVKWHRTCFTIRGGALSPDWDKGSQLHNVSYIMNIANTDRQRVSSSSGWVTNVLNVRSLVTRKPNSVS